MGLIKTFKIVLAVLSIVTICSQTGLANSSIPPLAFWNSLLKSNKDFVKSHTYAKQRAKLIKAQNPPVIILSCSDSRVPPELVFDKGLGSLFVVRVAGEVTDDVVIDSIEYAVSHFNPRLIVVLGHSGCGAVSGALKHLQRNGGVIDQPHGHLGAVLIPIETAIVQAGINIYGPKALEQSIQANVAYVANQLISHSSTISDALNAQKLNIIGAEYCLGSGKVKKLFVIS